MNDIGNGSYSYTYSVTRSGTISIYIHYRKSSHINAWLYGSSSLTNLRSQTTVSQISGNWSGYESGNFTSNLRGPTCGAVTITASSDDGCTFIRDGVYLWNGYHRNGRNSYRYDTSFNYKQFYKVETYWADHHGGQQYFNVSWNYTGTTCNGEAVSAYSGIIPGSHWYSDPLPIGSTPHNILAICKTGYRANSASNECEEISGDGFRVGDEV